MKTLNKLQYKKEIIPNDLKGLCVYEKPFIFRITEDKKCFYYSETGILVSARKHENNQDLNKSYKNRFVVNIQYDYRSGDDLQNFGFVRNTGTYGMNLFCKNLEEAIQETLIFLNSDFVDYRSFSGEKIEQKNIVSIREVAKSQSLHHISTFRNHIKENDLYLKLLIACGEGETLKKYIQINENREQADKKYLSKLENRFKKDFDFELKEIINCFQISLHLLKNRISEELNEKQQKTLQKVFKYFR